MFPEIPGGPRALPKIIKHLFGPQALWALFGPTGPKGAQNNDLIGFHDKTHNLRQLLRDTAADGATGDARSQWDPLSHGHPKSSTNSGL